MCSVQEAIASKTYDANRSAGNTCNMKIWFKNEQGETILISQIHCNPPAAFAFVFIPLLIAPLFLSRSESHEGHSHGYIHSLTAQCLQWEWMWSTGVLASWGSAGCHPHEWLHCAWHPPTSHWVRDLQNGAGCPGQVLAVQWPETKRWVQSRPAGEESHFLSNAFNSVCFFCTQIWRVTRGE